MTVQTRTIKQQQNGLITRAADFSPNTLNEEARTVEVVFSTGIQGKKFNWSVGEFVEALEVSKRAIRLERFNSGVAPVLDNHNNYSGIKGVLGVVLSSRIDNGLAYCTI